MLKLKRLSGSVSEAFVDLLLPQPGWILGDLRDPDGMFMEVDRKGFDHFHVYEGTRSLLGADKWATSGSF